MRFVLAALLLTGVSFVAWGITGLCRFLHERDRSTRLRAAYVVAVAALACPVAALLIGSTGWAVASPADPWVTRGWLVACGAIAGFATLWFFRVERLGLAMVVIAGLYALLLEAMPSAAAAGPPWWIPIIAAVSATLGASAAEIVGHKPARLPPEPPRDLAPADVAVIVCAHDEEAVIGNCLERVLELVPAANVFVGSDGSTDRTVEIVRRAGCQVLDIQPNRGKARALAAVLEHFEITRRFEVALILDADSEIDRHYVARALPLFEDARVVAVAGHANPKWYRHWLPRWSMFFAAYRVRLYALTQALLRYGQTWSRCNVSFIVPGFASMYRCRVLEQIDVAAPGLSVEDFNMTFEIHRKRLGRIAYTPRVRCTSQEAHGLVDYVKQVRRWYLGFWQTVRRHGIWPSFFWLSLGFFAVEMLIASIVLLTVPLALSWFIFEGGDPALLWLPPLGTVEITVLGLIAAVLVADYALTVAVAALEKKPLLLIYGVGFAVLRYIDAFLFVYTLPLAFLVRSDGRWASPRRLLAKGNQ